MEEYRKTFDNYEVSNLGNIRRLLTDGNYKTIHGSVLNSGGYKYFQTQKQGKRQNHLFHCLVAKAFIGERPDKYVIDHIDRNPLNNNVSNLRYISHTENLHNCDKYRDDIQLTGKERINRLARDRMKKQGGKTQKQKENNKNYMYVKATISCIKYLFETF